MCYSNNNPLAPYRSLGRAVSPIGSVLFIGYRLPMPRQTCRNRYYAPAGIMALLHGILGLCLGVPQSQNPIPLRHASCFRFVDAAPLKAVSVIHYV